MKRNLQALIIILMLPFGVVTAQTTIWSSSCDNLVGWSGQDIDGDGSNWFNYSGGDTFGLSGRVHGSPSATTTPNNAIFTPTFSIPNGAEDINLKIKVAASSATNYSENFSVYIQENGVGAPLDNFLYGETLSNGGTNSAKVVSLTIPNSFAGKNVKIVIRHHDCSNQDYLLIDDLLVTYGTTLSSANANFEGFSTYPNPVKDYLSFRSNQPINSIEIYNLIGQKVKSFDTTSIFDNKINISELRQGTYLVKIVIDNQQKTIKMIKG